MNQSTQNQSINLLVPLVWLLCPPKEAAKDIHQYAIKSK